MYFFWSKGLLVPNCLNLVCIIDEYIKMHLTLHFFLYTIVLMKFTKLFAVLFLLLSIGVTTPLIAQVAGGRKKEHRNQRGGGIKLFGAKSRGNATTFAKGNHKGFLARIFKGNKSGGAWVYHKTDPGKKQKKEQPKLFSRNRTKGKKYTDGIIAQQNKKRSSTRVRGNFSFSKKKH